MVHITIYLTVFEEMKRGYVVIIQIILYSIRLTYYKNSCVINNYKASYIHIFYLCSDNYLIVNFADIFPKKIDFLT